ncbi:MAG: hypothetical protein RLZZ293_980 [Pseudomonadota bacterium]|jgi:ribonuclease G
MLINKLLIYRQDNLLYSLAYTHNSQLAWFCCDEQAIYSEAIFLTKVLKVYPQQQIAFIEYLPQQTGFMNYPKYVKLQDGSTLIAQLTWQGSQDKDAKFRYGAQLVGKFVVVKLSDKFSLDSSRLKAQLANELHQFAKQFAYAWIIRSSATSLSDLSLIKAEMTELAEQLEQINQQRQTTTNCLFIGNPSYLKMLRNLTLTTDCQIICNDQKILDTIKSKQVLWQLKQIQLIYQNDLNLDEIIINYHNNLATSEVQLANGARLEIHQVSGIHLIDINSDKLRLSHSKLNLLVLDAIYQQICLRNLQGIILLDLVKNLTPQQQQQIIDYLNKLFTHDISKTKVLGFSHSGLCELIRQKF